MDRSSRRHGGIILDRISVRPVQHCGQYYKKSSFWVAVILVLGMYGAFFTDTANSAP
jgi:hypothetical protein